MNTFLISLSSVIALAGLAAVVRAILIPPKSQSSASDALGIIGFFVAVAGAAWFCFLNNLF
jgi:hypothetical protein